MDFMNYIAENALVLIPVIYIIGMFLKGLKGVSDKYIPFVLMFVSIAFSIAMLGLNVDSIIQGILVTGVTVLGNQLIKQSKKDE